MISKAPHSPARGLERLPSDRCRSICSGLLRLPRRRRLSTAARAATRRRWRPGSRRDRSRHGGHALASIDVLVVPSIWPENAPLVIQEAFLAGIPVVASRIGGIPEMVTDGKNGLLFTAGDAVALSRTLARLIDEPGLVDPLRDGIPAVRSIEDDVGFARSLYQTLQPLRSQSTQSRNVSSFSASSAVNVQRLAAVVLNFRTPDETLLAVKSLLASRRPSTFSSSSTTTRTMVPARR